jgi:hypothetical protein
VERVPPETHDFDVMGHHVRVRLYPDERWRVWVDRSALGADFPSFHEAWASGVAESYRRGPLARRRRARVEADAGDE